MNLKELILKNPELPVVLYNTKPIEICFCELIVNAEIQQLTEYDGRWMDKDEYTEKLWDDIYDIEDYSNLSDEELSEIINKKVVETEFTNVIVGWI